MEYIEGEFPAYENNDFIKSMAVRNFNKPEDRLKVNRRALPDDVASKAQEKTKGSVRLDLTSKTLPERSRPPSQFPKTKFDAPPGKDDLRLYDDLEFLRMLKKEDLGKDVNKHVKQSIKKLFSEIQPDGVKKTKAKVADKENVPLSDEVDVEEEEELGNVAVSSDEERELRIRRARLKAEMDALQAERERRAEERRRNMNWRKRVKSAERKFTPSYKVDRKHPGPGYYDADPQTKRFPAFSFARKEDKANTLDKRRRAFIKDMYPDWIGPTEVKKMVEEQEEKRSRIGAKSKTQSQLEKFFPNMLVTPVVAKTFTDLQERFYDKDMYHSLSKEARELVDPKKNMAKLVKARARGAFTSKQTPGPGHYLPLVPRNEPVYSMPKAPRQDLWGGDFQNNPAPDAYNVPSPRDNRTYDMTGGQNPDDWRSPVINKYQEEERARSRQKRREEMRSRQSSRSRSPSPGLNTSSILDFEELNKEVPKTIDNRSSAWYGPEGYLGGKTSSLQDGGASGTVGGGSTADMSQTQEIDDGEAGSPTLNRNREPPKHGTIQAKMRGTQAGQAKGCTIFL